MRGKIHPCCSHMSRSQYATSLPTLDDPMDFVLVVLASIRGPDGYPIHELGTEAYAALIWQCIMVPGAGRAMGWPYSRHLANWSRFSSFLLGSANMVHGVSQRWPYPLPIPEGILEGIRRRIDTPARSPEEEDHRRRIGELSEALLLASEDPNEVQCGLALARLRAAGRTSSSSSSSGS